MSIETLNGVATLPGMTMGAENLPPSNGTDAPAAFTATLQAQVERLNAISPATINPITVTPEQNPAMTTADLKATAPITTSDSSGISLQSTTPADLTSAFPALLTDVLSTPDRAISDAVVTTEPVAAIPTPPQALIASNGNNPPQPSVTPIVPPTSASDTLAATDITAEPQNTLSAIATETAPANFNKPTPAISVPAMRQTSKTIQSNDADATVTSSGDLLKATTTTPNTPTDSPFISNANASSPTKKSEKTSAPEEIAAMVVMSIPPETPVPIETAPNLLNQSQTQDTAINSLLQAGVLQAAVTTPLKTVTPKTETNAVAVPISLAGAKAPSDTQASPALLPEASASNKLENLLQPLEAGTTTTSFATVLDNLKPSEASSALDAGLSKSLANLGAELAAFDRPANNAVKMEVPAMTAHLYSPDFNEELGTKIMWMTSQKMSSAELTLNPPHLGPVSVHINMQQDQASVAFTTHNASAKEMLEASIPKLREMLQTQNLNLTDVNVSQQSFGGQNQAYSPNFGQPNEGQKRAATELGNTAEPNAPVNEAAEHIEQSRTVVSNGLVSLYA